jgi:2-polyprenyl-3-methyl-5-hydroxy-6-metoxy-1,4-benzoquinol methylase
MSADHSIARVREYWNSRPCNIRHSTAEVGSRQYFDEVEARKYFVEAHIPRLAEFECWRGKRVLEIGCGIGTDTVQFVRAGAQVTAVDLSSASLELARRRMEVYGLDATLIQANVEELSNVVPVEKYDLVYSFGVLHHTPHPERAFAELRKYMDAESELRIMVYNRWSWKALGIFLRYGRGRIRQFDEVVAKRSEAQTGCPVTFTYSRRSVRRLLSGFAVDNMWVDHIFPYRIADYVQYRYRKIWYFRMIPTPLFRALEQALGWHLCVSAHLSDAAT